MIPTLYLTSARMKVDVVLTLGAISKNDSHQGCAKFVFKAVVSTEQRIRSGVDNKKHMFGMLEIMKTNQSRSNNQHRSVDVT